MHRPMGVAGCVFALAGMPLPGPAATIETYSVAPIHKLTRTELPAPHWLKGEAVVDCARNESEAVQVVFRTTTAATDVRLDIEGLRDPAGGAALPASAVRVHRVEYVDINAPFEPDKPSETPDLRPDPLPPVDLAQDRFILDPGQNLVFWVIVTVPETQRPGTYYGQVKAWLGDAPAAALDLRLRVRSFALPRRPILQSLIGLASGNIYKAHGCRTREDKEKVIRLYLDEYARARLSPFLYAPGTMAFSPLPEAAIKWEFVKDPEGKPTGDARLDFAGFDREAELYIGQRDTFSAFNFAPYLWARRDDAGKNTVCLRFADAAGTVVEGRRADGSENPTFAALVVSVFRAIATHLAEKGWLDRALYYVTDEPGEDDVPALKEICLLIRQADPRLRTALTYDPANRPRLAELVQDGRSLISVWIPYCTMYREDVAADQRRKGADYWLYDVADRCLISHSGQVNRAMLWEVWQRQAGGFLYYLSTWWGRQATPWERPNFMLPEFTYRYHHGDGYFFYPPLRQGEPQQPVLDHLVPTIRWELLREGAEDYDYLRLLERLIAAAEKRDLTTTAGRNALESARHFVETAVGPATNYGIRDLVFTPTPGWTFGLEEGWLHHPGGTRSDLPITVRTTLPDGRYDLVLNVYQDADYRGRPYSHFLVDGRPGATPTGGIKGGTNVAAGSVEVRGGQLAFTLSSTDDGHGVILYRVGARRAPADTSAGLYAVRAEVADAIETLEAAVGKP